MFTEKCAVIIQRWDGHAKSQVALEGSSLLRLLGTKRANLSGALHKGSDLWYSRASVVLLL